jgi:hypothetical protein
LDLALACDADRAHALEPCTSANIVLRVAGNKLCRRTWWRKLWTRPTVPLFLEELTKAVLESDMLVETSERYDYSGAVGKLAIPPLCATR